jgi:ABC-2 type transport system permease protein
MTLQQLKSFSRLFINLLKKDLLIYFRNIYLGDLLDNMIWTGTFIFIMTYVLPHVGLSAKYGAFFAVSMLISVAFWDIEYYLTLPIPTALYFIEQLCYFAIRAGSLSIGIVPLTKIILWNQFDLSQVALFSTLIIFVSSLFFCATMSQIMASMVKDINNLGHVGIRTLFPMFSTGGTQYSWLTMYSLSPVFAYISLANPLLYATEGMHAAMLGQIGYLPIWICITMISIFTLVLGWWSIQRMKKRLDCV